jgi:hypothetical protein
MTQSGIRLPDGEALNIRNAGDGMYVVENSYSGVYEYFEGRPIEIDVRVGAEEPVEDTGRITINILSSDAA